MPAETAESDLETTLKEILSRQPVVGIAIGVVRNGAPLVFRSHGLADIASRKPVAEDTVFRIASITKTFTAVAIMQLYERGLVDLDVDANEYLRAYRLVAAEPAFRPATLRHLLTHTAGLPEVAHVGGIVRPDFGESFAAGRPMPALAEFYGGALGVGADPGRRFVYNNHGPATLGQIVEDVTGSTLDRYFHDHIFAPLGMTSSSLLRTGAVEARLASGYEIHSRRLKHVEDREMVTAGAASIYSTPADMARYVAALLGSGSNEHGSILQPETVETMFGPHWQPDPRIAGMGLGFFRAQLDGHRVVRHQGTHPGFHSEMALAPDDGVGVIAFTNGAHKPDFWLPAAIAGLMGKLVGARSSERAVVPQRPELWHGICGWYRLDAGCTDVRLRGMLGVGAEVFVAGGRLRFRFLTPIPSLARGFPLEPDDPDDPYVFRIDLPDAGLDPIRVVFGQSQAGTTSRLFLDLMPLALDKQPATTNPRRRSVRAIAAVGALSGLVAVGRRLSSGMKV
jgi:CubicO group peptidase (beta-lactamase class C family)